MARGREIEESDMGNVEDDQADQGPDAGGQQEALLSGR